MLFFISFSVSQVSSQNINLKGSIKDSLGQVLPNTNVLAKPLTNAADFQFAISGTEGKYSLKLQKSHSYELSVTHLGFNKIVDTISLEDDTQRNFTLQNSTEQLDEVIIETEMAVIVKEDTITYRTDQFKTGEERKLRDVLKKLPGMKVDRAGNVTVNGKPVTKLMVDGKAFFTGDEKLAVNNIPADAIGEVEALDNYSEIAFLKGLEDSNRMALNIKLKEGKKRFLFGDVAAAGGIKNRYKLNPTLFYYSPKTAVNIIGDLNNTGQKSFTFKDYIDFEGGYDKATNSNNLNLVRD
ncbi:MAG: carboxypeptidase-like regulatory domain-containing protein, partial [Psychroflexus sp.]|nr:carboxypeptidase-like regulatory domain-containing protein [Psychroflexus sp.]